MDLTYKLGLLLCLVALLLHCYMKCHACEDGPEKQSKMCTQMLSGAIRGGISGLILGGPQIAVLSGATMAFVNPVMAYAGM